MQSYLCEVYVGPHSFDHEHALTEQLKLLLNLQNAQSHLVGLTVEWVYYEEQLAGVLALIVVFVLKFQLHFGL